MKQNSGEFTLKDLWNFMVSKVWVILLCAIVGGFLMYSYAKSKNTVTYSVSTSLFVESLSESADGKTKTSNVSISKQRVPLYMEIIRSNKDFHREILLKLGEEGREKYGFSKTNPDDLASLRKMASMIRTEQSGDLEMFYVHVTSVNLDCAMDVSIIIKDLSTEKVAEKNAVYKNIGAPSTINCVDSPRANGASSSHNQTLSLMVGVFAGAMVAVLGLWLYSAFDNRIRNQRALELNFDVPILGVIPKVSADSMTVQAYLERARRSGDE